MTRLDDKIGEYKRREVEARPHEFLATVPFQERERAELEAEIWALVGLEERALVNGMGPWLAERLGGMRLPYLHRSALLGVGEAAEPFWKRVDQDMAISTATELLRTAKRLAPGATGQKLLAVVVRVLQDYDARPVARTLPTGKVVKQRGTMRLPSAYDGAKRSDRGAHTFWAKLRPILGDFLQGQMGDLGPEMGEELYRGFERDLNALCDEYQSKIMRAKKKGTTAFSVSRRQVIDASAVLAMDPPAPGEPVDLAAARRQQRRQAKLYHPDAHAGDASMRVQYERVMHAYQVLEQYQAAQLRAHREIIEEQPDHDERKRDDGNARGNDHG